MTLDWGRVWSLGFHCYPTLDVLHRYTFRRPSTVLNPLVSLSFPFTDPVSQTPLSLPLTGVGLGTELSLWSEVGCLWVTLGDRFLD